MARVGGTTSFRISSVTMVWLNLEMVKQAQCRSKNEFLKKIQEKTQIFLYQFWF